MSVFPFVIVVTAIAGFIGSVDLANEVARLLFAAYAGKFDMYVEDAIASRTRWTPLFLDRASSQKSEPFRLAS
jgi:hypothetical protein